MQDFQEFSFNEFSQWLKGHDHPVYHAKQVFEWVYSKGVRDWSAMTNLASPLRQALSSAFHLDVLKEEAMDRVSDTAVDITYRLRDGRQTHTIAKPGVRKGELHLSSQIGRSADCCFLPLGRAKWTRHLRAAEIIDQALLTKQRLGKGGRLFFDGVGEPLANARHLVKAVSALCDSQRGGFAPRQVHIATLGLVSGLEALLTLKLPLSLIVELHAPNQRVRQGLIPIAKKNRMDALMPLLHRFAQQTGQAVTYRYCLIRGVNDSSRDANELARLLRKTRAHVELQTLPSHHVKKYQPSVKKQIKDFRNVLFKEKIAHRFLG